MDNEKCHCGHVYEEHVRYWTTSDTHCAVWSCDCSRFLSSNVTHNTCEYCWAPFPFRTRKYETRPQAIQPRACCPEHSARLRAWDAWINKGRQAATYGTKQPAMPKPPSPSLLASACL